MICSSACLLHFIIWLFLKATLHFSLDYTTRNVNQPSLALPGPLTTREATRRCQVESRLAGRSEGVGSVPREKAKE